MLLFPSLYELIILDGVDSFVDCLFDVFKVLSFDGLDMLRQLLYELIILDITVNGMHVTSIEEDQR